MAIDLSALEVFNMPLTAAQTPSQVAAEPAGKPLLILLSDIDEDPDQPRKEFPPDAMAGMVASIKRRGVKSPVSIRPHPVKKNRWMLNYGARRYRASIEAGRDTIPAFVDQAHDNYDQVIENLQRESLTPMELALFIKGKIAAGDKASAIARKLGKQPIAITEHMALIDPPACVEEAYATGKSQSPRTLHQLRKLYVTHPEQVAAWCADAEEITRSGVEKLANSISGKKGRLASTEGNGAVGGSSKSLRHAQKADGHSGSGDEDGEGRNGTSNAATAGKSPLQRLDQERQPAAARTDDQAKIRKPVLLVEFDGRTAMVMLARRPSTPGLLHIKYEDSGEQIEVDGNRCKINCLIESVA